MFYYSWKKVDWRWLRRTDDGLHLDPPVIPRPHPNPACRMRPYQGPTARASPALFSVTGIPSKEVGRGEHPSPKVISLRSENGNCRKKQDQEGGRARSLLIGYVTWHGSFTHLKEIPTKGAGRGDIGSIIPVGGYLAVTLYGVKFQINEKVDAVRAAMHAGQVHVMKNSWGCTLSPAQPS